MTVVLVTGPLVTVANIGDSSAVLDTGLSMLELTSSHRIQDNIREQASSGRLPTYTLPHRASWIDGGAPVQPFVLGGVPLTAAGTQQVADYPLLLISSLEQLPAGLISLMMPWPTVLT